MELWQWGIVAVLVLGAAIVALGALADRRSARRRAEAMTLPPDRHIPQFKPEAPRPEYLQELQARLEPDGATSYALDPEQRTALKTKLRGPGVLKLDGGFPLADFVTDPAEGWAVAEKPIVVICVGEVASIREVLGLLQQSQKRQRSLVLIAPRIDDTVLTTLLANHRRRKVRILPVLSADATGLAALATLAHAQPLDEADLKSGFLPESALGSVNTWVSDEGSSWAIA